MLQVPSGIQDGDTHRAISSAGEQATEIETAFKAGEAKASANRSYAIDDIGALHYRCSKNPDRNLSFGCKITLFWIKRHGRDAKRQLIRAILIQADDIEALYKGIKDKAAIIEDLNSIFYSAREFCIRDSSGHVLAFASSQQESVV